jgi:integrase
MTPQQAVDHYMEIRDFDRSGTENTQRSSLSFFVRYCNEVADIKLMNELSSKHLTDYKVWRRDESSDRVDKLQPKSVKTQQQITKKFIEYCEKFDAVRPDLHSAVIVPSLDAEDEVRDDVLEHERADVILAYLREFEYATVEHVVLELLAGRGLRLSDLRALDVNDFGHDDGGPYIDINHRPASETPLKNGKAGERMVSLSGAVATIIEDYLVNNHTGASDGCGRVPLIASKYGRTATSTIRNYIYWWTEPCKLTGVCPFGRDVGECDAARRKSDASKCPGSLSCHPLRKGYITQRRRDGVSGELLGERCDVSPRVLDKHYDHRSKRDRMQTRRRAFEDFREGE